MEPIRALPGVVSAFTVNERQAGGGKRQADAFRQALQQQGAPAGQQEPRTGQRPVRSTLQPSVPDSRRDGEACHVDVIA